MTENTQQHAMADFDWQITMLFKVLGAQLSVDQLKNAHLAQVLKIEPSGVTQRRNGKTALQIGEAAKIIHGYGLNIYELDHRLFDITDPDRFLQELKSHGVGVFETNPRRRLAQVLEAAIVETGLSVEIREARGRRGISYVSDGSVAPDVYRVAQQIEIVVRAAEGRHIAVIQRILDMTHVMETIAPTATLPNTYMDDPRLLLPGEGRTGLEIRRPTGRYKLVAVEGDEDLVALFSGEGLARLENGETNPESMRPVPITDQTASAILKRLDKTPGAIRCAALDFIVDD